MVNKGKVEVNVNIFNISRNFDLLNIVSFSNPLVQSLSCVPLFVTLWTAAHQASLSIINSQSLLTHVHRVGYSIQPSHLLSSTSPPASNLSYSRVFFKESVLCTRWPKYCSFSFNISPSNEYSALISFRMDLFDLCAVQETLESSSTRLFKSISSLVLAFFMVQLSYL